MQDVTVWVQHVLKRGVAIVVFTVLLVGSAGAVLSIVAAGVTALGNPHGSTYAGSGSGTANSVVALAGQASVANSTGSSSPLQSGQTTNRQSAGTASSTVSTAASRSQSSYPFNQVATAPPGPSVVDKLNSQLAGMQSPVIASLDSGGVSLGDQVQSVFGQFLSGILQTMFVERANQQGTVQTSSTGG